MTTKVQTLDSWTASRNALATLLGLIFELQQTLTFSTDPGSAYQKAEAQAARILEQLKLLAVLGLREVDSAIANSSLVQQLNAQAKTANQEADALKTAAKTIAKISGVIDDVVGTVDGILGLPFI